MTTMAAGTVRGERINNPGHIERVAGVRWQGQSDDQSADARFVVFDAPKWGIRAICRTLITYQDKRGISTVRGMISRWAPPQENDTPAYIDHVCQRLGVGPDDAIDVYDWPVMRALVDGIIRHEIGRQPYDDATLASGLIAAGLQAPSGKTAAASTTGWLTSAGAAATAVVTAAPAIKDAYDQTLSATKPLEALAVWLPPLLGMAVAIGVVIVTVRNLHLSKLVKD